jgi:hypothetical protein
MILEIINRMDYSELEEHVVYTIDEKIFRKVDKEIWRGLIKFVDDNCKEGRSRILAHDVYDSMEIIPAATAAREINVKLKKYAF